AYWAEALRQARRGKIGIFGLIHEDPPEPGEISLPVLPTATEHMSWKDGLGAGFGPDASLMFVLKEPQLVYAVRLNYSYCRTAQTAPLFQMSWRRSDHNDFSEAERVFRVQLGADSAVLEAEQSQADEKVLTVWVYDTIDQFRIHPNDKPCVF